jgi:hypothetical protein
MIDSCCICPAPPGKEPLPFGVSPKVKSSALSGVRFISRDDADSVRPHRRGNSTARVSTSNAVRVNEGAD